MVFYCRSFCIMLSYVCTSHFSHGCLTRLTSLPNLYYKFILLRRSHVILQDHYAILMKTKFKEKRDIKQSFTTLSQKKFCTIYINSRFYTNSMVLMLIDIRVRCIKSWHLTLISINYLCLYVFVWTYIMYVCIYA